VPNTHNTVSRQDQRRRSASIKVDYPQGNHVAEHCLACGNCTMVCPTCFCVTFKDSSDVTGQHAERWRKWDSCYSLAFSYIHGGNIRSSMKSRYRQWLTHKYLPGWSNWELGFGGPHGCPSRFFLFLASVTGTYLLLMEIAKRRLFHQFTSE
jgi:ferredoxin